MIHFKHKKYLQYSNGPIIAKNHVFQEKTNKWCLICAEFAHLRYLMTLCVIGPNNIQNGFCHVTYRHHFTRKEAHTCVL